MIAYNVQQPKHTSPSSKDTELIEKIRHGIDLNNFIHHKSTKVIKDMEGKSYADRLRSLALWTREERRYRHDVTELLKSLTDHLVLELINCLCWMKTRKVREVTA